MLDALAKPLSNALFVMPEAVAKTSATAEIASAVGSGPFIFDADIVEDIAAAGTRRELGDAGRDPHLSASARETMLAGNGINGPTQDLRRRRADDGAAAALTGSTESGRVAIRLHDFQPSVDNAGGGPGIAGGRPNRLPGQACRHAGQ